jgi:hypothetical protein
MSLGKTDGKHRKTMRQFELDIRDDTAETAVEFTSTLGRYGFILQTKQCLMRDNKVGKGWTRKWKAIAVF